MLASSQAGIAATPGEIPSVWTGDIMGGSAERRYWLFRRFLLDGYTQIYYSQFEGKGILIGLRLFGRGLSDK